jgi:hypothetical protein
MTMKYTKIIKEEELPFYECFLIVKIKKEKTSLSEAYDEIRAIPYIVTVQPKHSDFIESKSNDIYEYAQLQVKFLSSKGSPIDSLNEIKTIALKGMGNNLKYKVTGLVGLLLRPDSLKLIEK